MADYQYVDADNHYYEAEDAFLRYADRDVKQYVRWISEGKRRYMVFGSTMIGVANTGVPNPTFNPVATPGAFHERLRELQERKSDATGIPITDMFNAYGQLEEIPDGYRKNYARIDMIDEQNVEKCLLFPTLGDCVEGLMHDNPPMAYKVFHAFNLWLEEDWGYAYQDRLFAPPYIPMLDPELAADELEFVLNKGVKAVSLRPGPADGRSPADPAWDRFWSLMNESGTLAAYHGYGGHTRYTEAFKVMWGQSLADPGYNASLDAAFNSDRGILELTVALVLGNLFGRYPNVKIASIELGCKWTQYALHMVDHAGSLLERRIEAFGQTLQDLPSDVFKEHIYISPFPEEDVVGLTELVGVDRVLMGSDWPHPEGNIMPGDFADSIQKLPEADIKKIMRDNLNELLS
jgi:predicted TIM-barrel fold metal-dependent hydrolase